MSIIKLNKKKSSSSTASTSSGSSGECYNAPHSNKFTKFDEKKDYFKRCNKTCNKKGPSPVSFCLSK